MEKDILKQTIEKIQYNGSIYKNVTYYLKENGGKYSIKLHLNNAGIISSSTTTVLAENIENPRQARELFDDFMYLHHLKED
ncbi:hypothetical protein HRH69_07325 [Enterococcus faecalis]|uniref:hypothetical protein n=1 Tax=Enterococcus faecalis TaxID=1351 RepID=UPI0011415EFF|nr:hypothetical protein [Enterococcus faecalis]NSW13758.1 hypothetical protein [Enterococcus faecalis]TQB25382.1 hypothetical protein FKZ16_09990 [Enterococcus faecalis]